MAKAALDAIGSPSRVWAVSRFSSQPSREALESADIQTIGCDLLVPAQVARLPDAPNVLYLAGQKFGTTERPDITWAMNTLVPAHVAERFSTSRIVAFSTGCVYSFADVAGSGSAEDAPTQPLGDYPNSCLGRERIFEFYAHRNQTPVALYRLNYAIDFRYGVLLDVAQKVAGGLPVDVTMGHVNVIWQGDACARALQCLEVAASPAVPINITGPEKVAIRDLAERFGQLLGKTPKIIGTEAAQAWLNDASKSFGLFGQPSVSLEQMIEWTAAWIQSGGATLGKPTHFEVRTGKF
jgi:nucleoside-diphosphate-sugar epimerase